MPRWDIKRNRPRRTTDFELRKRSLRICAILILCYNVFNANTHRGGITVFDNWSSEIRILPCLLVLACSFLSAATAEAGAEKSQPRKPIFAETSGPGVLESMSDRFIDVKPGRTYVLKPGRHILSYLMTVPGDLPAPEVRLVPEELPDSFPVGSGLSFSTQKVDNATKGVLTIVVPERTVVCGPEQFAFVGRSSDENGVSAVLEVRFYIALDS